MMLMRWLDSGKSLETPSSERWFQVQVTAAEVMVIPRSRSCSI